MRLIWLILSVLLLADCSRAQKTDAALQDVSAAPFILVDQFGYQPGARKIAILRSPSIGFDREQSYSPGDTLWVRDLSDNRIVYEGPPIGKATAQPDPASGDLVWWFDFSDLQAAGRYVVEDPSNSIVSDEFEIATNVYRPVLKQAVLTLYYQRAGFAKSPPFADPKWADAASHLQDRQARRFLDKLNPGTERDLSGGWYDAGDYNQYTNWTARYIEVLLHAFLENPDVWTDDFGIPESGNGVPDLLDEIRWGLDWLIRMQNEDGSVLSILGRDEAAIPSEARGASYYGDASGSATLSTATVFALAGVVWRDRDEIFARELFNRSQQAYAWASRNKEVTFYNNSPENGTDGLGAGQQEVDETGRAKLNQKAFVYLMYANLERQPYTTVQTELNFDRNSPYAVDELSIKRLARTDKFIVRGHEPEPGSASQGVYVTDLSDYHWGSNGIVAREGLLSLINATPERASRLLNYLHGVNPMGLVYMTNMGEFGAERSAQYIFHAWHGGKEPPPGFLVGGPNQYYEVNACCPNSCGSPANNARCEISGPPLNQPPLKSFRDFSDGWPRDSWQISEPSLSYQVDYIRLLAHFVGE